MDELYEYSTILSVVIIATTYGIYYLTFAYFKVKMVGNYDITKKTLGKHLPFYPNGWYIAAKAK
jgi:hypothetical protein